MRAVRTWGRRSSPSVLCAVVLAVLGFAATGAAAEFEIPALSSPVVDRAGLLSASSKARLEAALQVLKRQGGTQLAVLTVPNLEGLAIEQASIRVSDQWQLGTTSEDNGVLLMIARDERRLRIEVGQGLEGVLTDAHSKRIIDEAITPLFRSGDIDAGVTVGIFEIAKRTNPDLDLRPHLEGGLRTRANRGGTRRTRSSPLSTFLFLLLAVPVAFMRMGLFGGRGYYRRRGGYHWGAGGFGGGGGFSSGGFSGGGGGFSGGGASGGW